MIEFITPSIAMVAGYSGLLIPTLIAALNELHKKGWAVFESEEAEQDSLSAVLLGIASVLGEAVPSRAGGGIIDVLRPLDASQARPRSLTRVFSNGEFPLHSDTAYWPKPCRYLLLACVHPGDGERPTNILDSRAIQFTHDELNALRTSPFVVKNGRNSFFATVLSNDLPMIRYDQGCMNPVSCGGYEIQEMFHSARHKEQIYSLHWRRGLVLILDNWRVLHGRAGSSGSGWDMLRTLLRISIK